MSVKIRISKTKAALQKMTDAFIARGIAESMQGKTLRAVVNLLDVDGSAYLIEGQGFPQYFLPKGSFSIFVSRAAALAQTKQLARVKAKTPRHRPFRIKK